MTRRPTTPNGDRDRTAPIVLVIDDDDYIHTTLAAALRSLRPEVIRASTAAEGRSLAHRRRPDLAFVDLGLPDADGHDVCRDLRADPSLEGLRIVILTGRWEDEATARAAGADAILLKPFRISALRALVDDQLRRPADQGSVPAT